MHTDSRAASIHDDGRKKIEIENAIEVLIGIGERFERGAICYVGAAAYVLYSGAVRELRAKSAWQLASACVCACLRASTRARKLKIPV